MDNVLACNIYIVMRESVPDLFVVTNCMLGQIEIGAVSIA